MKIVCAALYKFVSLPDYEDIQPKLKKICDDNEVMGTLLLAKEGINGTISGSRCGIDAVLTYLKSDDRMSDLEHKESYTNDQPFHRMKVRLKKEIVTIGNQAVNPTEIVGTYVEAKDWNKLIEDPEVVIVDTRNDYEYDIGTFKGAVNPNTKSFRDFPEYTRKNLDPKKNKKVAMFCTGGIRCEKASSFMLSEGFEEVYHLKGGILKYLETVPQKESTWEGECFVFDNRVSVDSNLDQGTYGLCHGCRHPITAADMQCDTYEAGVSCPHCIDQVDQDHIMRVRERQKQVKLAKTRGERHIGMKAQQKA